MSMHITPPGNQSKTTHFLLAAALLISYASIAEDMIEFNIEYVLLQDPPAPSSPSLQRYALTR